MIKLRLVIRKINAKETDMKAEYINPFVEASMNVIKETTGFSLTLGKIFVKDTPYKSGNVLVFIGLTGRICGSVVINFSKGVACSIASAMMMGASVPELSEIAKSAIGELCNMILGNTATLFSKKKINIDITPPAILTGDNLELSVHKSIIVCIPILLEDGNRIEIDISYVDQ
jgi:chemotaxis protein CheX